MYSDDPVESQEDKELETKDKTGGYCRIWYPDKANYLFRTCNENKWREIAKDNLEF